MKSSLTRAAPAVTLFRKWVPGWRQGGRWREVEGEEEIQSERERERERKREKKKNKESGKVIGRNKKEDR